MVEDIFDALGHNLASLRPDDRNLATFHVGVVHNVNILTGNRNVFISIKIGAGYFNARLTVKCTRPPLYDGMTFLSEGGYMN